MKDKNDKVQTDQVRREEGCVNPKMVKKYNLTTDSRPEDYADILLSFKKNVQGGKERLSVCQLKD